MKSVRGTIPEDPRSRIPGGRLSGVTLSVEEGCEVLEIVESEAEDIVGSTAAVEVGDTCPKADVEAGLSEGGRPSVGALRVSDEGIWPIATVVLIAPGEIVVAPLLCDAAIEPVEFDP